MNRKRDEYEILDKILENKCIKPVFQPIVSLGDGQIFGYESLARISDDNYQMDISEMFNVADKMNRSWELEVLCRTKALEKCAKIDASKKLFLNVNPNIIYDDRFREGFTKEHLRKYNLDFHNIIFEITERVAVTDNKEFLDTIEHYRNQNYGIAIDDVGAGYSGLILVADAKPNFIKLDTHLVRNVNKDETKRLLCKAMADFGKKAGVRIIAEGIETEEELEALIKLDIDFGQGFFLATPQEELQEIASEKIALIQKYEENKHTEMLGRFNYSPSEIFYTPCRSTKKRSRYMKRLKITRKSPNLSLLRTVSQSGL